MGFRKDFIWGAATAAYQIEGAYKEDGKGLSVWDVCSNNKGFVKNNDTGNIACDHYHRYQEDVASMKEMGLQAYRFSISWPRVLPEGTGKINEKGLDFYDRLVDSLLDQGIQPYATLFHWDYPDELFKRGGILNRDSSDWFAEYTRVIVDRLSDRVSNWMTLNEPQCFTLLGHELGVHAPGIKLQPPYVLEGIHNMHLAHGKAVQTIRSYSKTKANVGMAPALQYCRAEENSKETFEEIKKRMFSCSKEAGTWSNSIWLDPVMKGCYPEDLDKVFGNYKPTIKEGDMETIHQPLDYFAFNYYTGKDTVTVDADGKVKIVNPLKTGYCHTALNWEFTPDTMYYATKALYEEYKLPILISENGLSNTDWVSLDGKVHDPQRIDFVQRHLRELKRAAEEGVDIMGYMHWSLLDNFEWAAGYNERFGLIFVDYETQKRTWKDSAYWYKQVIASNGENL